MGIFKSVTFSWWQIGVFKLALLSFGIILGVSYQSFFQQWIVFVMITFVVPALYTLKVWWKQ